MISSRALIVTLALLIVFLVLVSRLFVIQVSNHDKYVALAERQQTRSQFLKAQRGTIKDRNGDVLAYSKDDISFFCDTRMASAAVRAKIAAKFASVFEQDSLYFLNIMNSKLGNVCLVKKASQEKMLMLNDFSHESIFKSEDFTRVYPYGSLAAHAIGFTDHEYVGKNGIEKKFDEYLTGTDGKLFLEKDGKGRVVAIDEELSQREVDGNSIYLTINKTYQTILEEELEAGLKKVEGESAVGIIMNPNNGEILALANLPTYDPGNVALFSNDERRNRAVTDSYEPGSTMKTLVMSILLEEELANEDEVINTENGKYRLRGATIRDEHDYPKLTVREIIEFSSNIGMCKLSTRMEDEDLYKYLRDYGFGAETSIDLPSEAEGFLKKPKSFLRLTKPFMSHGYEISVTPMQLITAISAMINGGTLYKPYIVEKIVDEKNNTVEEFEPEKIRTVISASTSNKIKEFMVGVVENGTATNAQLDNVLVGGKTGTAQRFINGKYERKNYNASFVGFFPAEAPNIVCLVLVTHPKRGFFGGQVAAPIFRNVAERLVEADLNVVPEENRREMIRKATNRFAVEINNSQKKHDINDYLVLNPSNEDSEEIKPIPRKIVNRTTMPNLVKNSKRDAIAIVSELGLKYKIIGNGNVISQSIKPGTPINNGAVLLLKCKSSSKLSTTRIN